MKQLFLCLFLLPFIMVTGLKAQDSDVPYSKNFPVEDFNRIETEGNYKVFLYQSSKPYLKVKAPSDDLYDALDIHSDGNTLSISEKRPNFNINRIELHIGFRNLQGLLVKGGIKLITDGYLNVEDLEIQVEGAANVDLKLKARQINVISRGGSIFDLEGVADRLTVNVAGASHVNARELVTKDVIFRIEGVGFGSVHATDLLDVKIEGVGKVTFKGKPEVKRIVQGLGSVEEY